ncbi:MAG: transglycosylase domain-containing protein [Acidimicrobiales bacterium]
MWRYRRLLFLFTLVGFTGLSGAVYVLVRLPLPPETRPAESTIVTDANGVRLASFDAGENRVLVSLDKVPQVVIDAVLAAEDKSFFDHGGIDPVGLVRATWADVRGKALQGGSTITQQYVKNTYLTGERTVVRKLKEAVLAIKTERKLDKREILERYLNTIYFGRGAYGVQAAARAYFGTDVEQLGLREAAYLAGLIRAPEAADALRAPAAADSRRNRTLSLMVRAGSVTERQEAEARSAPVASYVVDRAVATTSFSVPDKGTQYFVEYVRRQLLADYGAATLYRGGLRVRTTLDLGTQAQAWDAVYGFLDRPDDPAGALVALDADGHVKAMVGGRDWNAEVPFAKVNLAVGTDGGGTGRQPGSTFKPFVLAAAVKAGFSVESTLAGPPEVTFPKADQGRDYPVKNFENADFGPTVNLVDATANSVNTVYAQLIKVVGPSAVIDLAHAAGITSNLVDNISLALGTSETSVLEMASGYSTFANRGVHVQPSVVLDVTTADGRVLRPATSSPRTRVLERTQADIVTYSLQQVVERGSGTGARIGRPLAGKTGTTQDFGDAWFVGYTPTMTAAVWMGFPEGNVQKMDNVRGRKVNGGSFPAAIFKRFMQAATKGTEINAFAPAPSLRGKALKAPAGVVLPTTTTTTLVSSVPADDPSASTATTKPAGAAPVPTPTTEATTTTSTTSLLGLGG